MEFQNGAPVLKRCCTILKHPALPHFKTVVQGEGEGQQGGREINVVQGEGEGQEGGGEVNVVQGEG